MKISEDKRKETLKTMIIPNLGGIGYAEQNYEKNFIINTDDNALMWSFGEDEENGGKSVENKEDASDPNTPC